MPALTDAQIAEKYSRTDSSFVWAIRQAQPTLDSLLAEGMDAGKAQQKLALLPERYLGVLTPLLRPHEAGTSEGLRTAAQRYPLEALALVIAAIDAEIEQREEERAALDRAELEAFETSGLPN